MKILDWYITRRFCLTLLYAILPFVLIVIFVDMVGNLAKFIDKDVPRFIIFKYYLSYIPQIVVLALPIAMLLSSLFCMGYMARYNELAAIKSAGISIYRTLAPILVASLFISVFALAFGEIVVPPANQNKSGIESRYLDPFAKRSKRWESNIFLRDKTDRRIFIGSLDTKTNLAKKVTIQKYNSNKIIERVDAPRMEWRDSTWVLFSGYKRDFSNDVEKATAFDTLRAQNLDVRPEKIIRLKVEPEDMSYGELKKFIAEVKRNGGDPARWLVDLHFKLSLPFANLIMVLFGAPLASHKKRSGAIFGFIISLLICFVYYGSNRLVQTMGQNGTIPPIAAAWLTNGVFLISGVFLLIFTRK
ncbi:LPS export ABC transporter permease LptG [candidate division KSB1 bacterium]|nr:LPS export ABC transporter permease LptG [candidate division KSB1 bacterium]NIR72968.1 LPS export ABC transporter permease LptG [candidate division KSB1 bacterium]NIS23774.1 LPS export ABC transporter permease LptG [candidate division KSB1 bacterium]NIT70693.1 LPS export ABC transporter permease LptG [candidate division KSB1 bacterium]NIU24424.1 LPS export ABC transporter permease LptG [candidate division KSB1 bacterium]